MIQHGRVNVQRKRGDIVEKREEVGTVAKGRERLERETKKKAMRTKG